MNKVFSFDKVRYKSHFFNKTLTGPFCLVDILSQEQTKENFQDVFLGRNKCVCFVKRV